MVLEGISCNTIGRLDEASATEKAMMQMVQKFGQNYEELRKRYLKDPFVRFQFTSKRKKMSTIMQDVEDAEFGYPKRLIVKGASEIVLNTCTYYINEGGERLELTEEMRNYLLSVIEDYARGALRTICLAYKDLREGEGGPTHEDEHEDGVNRVVEKDGLTCVAILGIRDIIRPEVPGAVAACKEAGIRVRMVTGDNKITALAIAKECGIITHDDENAVMEGTEFYERVGGLVKKKDKKGEEQEFVRDKDEFIKAWKNLDVLARSRPEDKYLLVTGLRELGEVVAVTGDGTNDAPALKKADVGFAMGITGTDVAKHAADIILLDDNFASIVKACMWGRNIYDNIRRFLQFQLTVNIVALISAFIGACILRESPLAPIQLLWVNLIMDSLGSLALATEPPKLDLLKRPPHPRDEYIISRKMVKHLAVMGIYQSIIVFIIVFAGEYFIPEDQNYEPRNGDLIHTGRLFDWNGDDLYKELKKDHGPSRHYAIVFNIFVLMQIFNMINARKINDEKNICDGIFVNSMFIVVWIIIFILQIIIVQFTQDVFLVHREVRPLLSRFIGTHWHAMVHVFLFRPQRLPSGLPHQVPTRSLVLPARQEAEKHFGGVWPA